MLQDTGVADERMLSELPNDPAADSLVARCAWVLCTAAGQDPDALDRDGNALWRGYIEMAISAIDTNKTLFGADAYSSGVSPKRPSTTGSP